MNFREISEKINRYLTFRLMQNWTIQGNGEDYTINKTDWKRSLNTLEKCRWGYRTWAIKNNSQKIAIFFFVWCFFWNQTDTTEETEKLRRDSLIIKVRFLESVKLYHFSSLFKELILQLMADQVDKQVVKNSDNDALLCCCWNSACLKRAEVR